MHHMDDVLAVAARAVLGEEVCDGLARLVDFGGLEESRGVFVLRVDDDEGGVLDGGRGGRDADDLAEGFGVGGHGGEVLMEQVDFFFNRKIQTVHSGLRLKEGFQRVLRGMINQNLI